MRILFLTPYPPHPPRGGGALRIVNLMRGLAGRHEVSCLSFAPDAQAVAGLAPLRAFCRLATVIGPPRRSLARRAITTLAGPLPDMALRNAAPAYAEALSRLLAAERFDVVQAESIEMAGYALLAPGFARGRPPLTILDEFNAEYVLQRRAALTDLRRGLRLRPRALVGGAYSLIQWAKLAAYERRLLRSFSRVLVVSEEDRAALRRLDRRADPAVVPNGVDTAWYAPPSGHRQAQATPPTLVFTGTLDFRPNIDALTWFVREVLPLARARRPELRLQIVGRAAGPAVQALHDGALVELVGEVEDVRPFIAGAAAYVVPMRIGGGSRLKLLEALAMGAPVVSTPMGAEGVEGLRDGEQLLLADRPAEFAAALLRLLDDATLADQLGRAGRAFTVERYDWRAIIPRLEAAYGDQAG